MRYDTIASVISSGENGYLPALLPSVQPDVKVVELCCRASEMSAQLIHDCKKLRAKSSFSIKKRYKVIRENYHCYSSLETPSLT